MVFYNQFSWTQNTFEVICVIKLLQRQEEEYYQKVTILFHHGWTSNIVMTESELFCNDKINSSRKFRKKNANYTLNQHMINV